MALTRTLHLTALAASILTATVTATPVAKPPTLVARDDNPLASGFPLDTSDLADLFDSVNNYTGPASLDVAFCGYNSGGLLPNDNYLVTIPDDSKYDSGGCGAGFLDNFRGRCGAVTEWGCNMVGATGGTAAMSFTVINSCTSGAIQDAIIAASGNGVPGITCIDSDDEDKPDGPDPSGGDGDDGEDDDGPKGGAPAPAPEAGGEE